MIFTPLALTICTCVNVSFGKIVITNNDKDVIYDAIEQVLVESSERLDYSNYDLTFDEQESLTQQVLFEFAKENKLFSDDELFYLSNEIKSYDNYVEFDDLDTLFISQEDINRLTYNSTNNKSNDFNSIMDDDQFDLIHFTDEQNQTFWDNIENNSASDENNNESTNTEANAETEISEETIEQLEILECNENNISSSANGKIDDHPFFGIKCSKDACVSLYNMFAKFINQQTVYNASGSGSPTKLVIDCFKALSASCAKGILLDSLIKDTISKITKAISSIWIKFTSLFSTSGSPIKFILGVVIAIVGLACIGTIVAMIVFGYLGKGFAVGWIIYALFDWRWYSGELD